MLKNSMEQQLEEVFSELSALPLEAPRKRNVCGRCKRPSPVCICSCFPKQPVPIQSRVIILQHPSEESRCLATVPLLQECIPKDKCHVIRGKRFGEGKNGLLDRALASPNSLLLYPGRSAFDLREIPPKPVGCHDDAALIVLDGTWTQAKGLFTQNPRLHRVRQVQLSVEVVSEYVIRTQPSRGSLSTLESIAHALAWLEHRPDIVEVTVRPLRVLCQHQLDHGAVAHHSKDDPDYVPREKLRLMPKLQAQAVVQDGSNNKESLADEPP